MSTDSGSTKSEESISGDLTDNDNKEAALLQAATLTSPVPIPVPGQRHRSTKTGSDVSVSRFSMIQSNSDDDYDDRLYDEVSQVIVGQHK